MVRGQMIKLDDNTLYEVKKFDRDGIELLNTHSNVIHKLYLEGNKIYKDQFGLIYNLNHYI